MKRTFRMTRPPEGFCILVCWKTQTAQLLMTSGAQHVQQETDLKAASGTDRPTHSLTHSPACGSLMSANGLEEQCPLVSPLPRKRRGVQGISGRHQSATPVIRQGAPASPAFNCEPGTPECCNYKASTGGAAAHWAVT